MPIEIKNVTYTYMPGTAFERTALKDVSLTVADGSFTAIAGHTGSGKSTLVQHFNGIISPTSGAVFVDGVDISKNDDEAKAARRKVGLVFQYPEHQIFEETVEKDIAFGPQNYGLGEEETKARVKAAMKLVGLSYDDYAARSPFSLSGGQKRRVAIAGILALKPKFLVLDEPTAGLDPKGRDKIMSRIVRLHKREKLTIVFISHNMDDIARYADRLIVMEHAKVLLDGEPEEVFAREETLESAGLSVPRIMSLQTKLIESGLEIDRLSLTPESGADDIFKALIRRKSC